MAGKGIVINFVSDIRRFIKGTDDIGEALEQVADSLDDVAREGEGATEQLERSFKDLTKVIDQETDDASRKMARNIDRGTDQAKRDLDELRNESRQNFAETFSSFDGSIESLLDGIQGTLGGVTAGLGSIPAFAAAAAGAAGLGILTNVIMTQQDEANKLRENLVGAYRAAAEEGRKYLSTAQVTAEATDIWFNPDRAGDLERYRREAELVGVDINTFVAAMAGDYEALRFAIDQAREAEADRRREYSGPGISAEQREGIVAPYRAVVDQLEVLGEQHSTNRELAEEYADFVNEQNRRESESIARVRGAEQDRWDALADRQAEAAARGPIVTETQLAEPNYEAFRRTVARGLAGKKIEVFVDLRGRIGRDPV